MHQRTRNEIKKHYFKEKFFQMMICFRFGNFKLILCINELEMKNKSISMEIFLSVVDVLILSCIQDSISSKDSQLFVMFSLDHWTKS